MLLDKIMINSFLNYLEVRLHQMSFIPYVPQDSSVQWYSLAVKA